LPGYGYARVSKTTKQVFQRFITDYFEQREQLVSAFVLVDIRHEPQKIDVEFMQWLGERAIPFAIIFTKADKLKPQAIERNVAAYKEALLEWWEEFPPYFVTSAQNKTGKEELTQYIEQTNQTIING
jgi:probable GTP-binding protein engB